MTLAATFRLPLGKQTTAVSNVMHPQLSSPLLQGATSSTPTSSSMLGLSANQQGILATHLQSPVTLQSTTTTPSRPSMPTLTPLSAASVSLTSSTTTSSNTQPLLNMPVLGRMQWISIFLMIPLFTLAVQSFTSRGNGCMFIVRVCSGCADELYAASLGTSGIGMGLARAARLAGNGPNLPRPQRT